MPTRTQPPRKPRFSHWPKLVLIVTLIVTTSCAWLMASDSGLHWLAAAVARGSMGSIGYQGLNGRVIGPIRAEHLDIKLGEVRIAVRELSLDWHPAALLQGRLEVVELGAASVAITIPSSDTDVPMPDDLRLPLTVELPHVQIGDLRLSSITASSPYLTATGVEAGLSADGQRIEIQRLQGRSNYGQLRASGVMQAARPFTLQAEADLVSIEELSDIDRKAHILAVANGDLRGFDIAATGAGAGLDGTAQVRIAPLAAVPLQALSLQVRGLDPHAFAPAAPKAQLKLDAELHHSATQLLEGKVRLHNDTATTLDRGGLPVLDGSAQLRLSAAGLRCDELLLKLPDAATVAGSFSLLHRTGLAELRVSKLNPAALDSRLRSAHLNGSVKLGGDAHEQQAKLELADTALQLSGELHKTGTTLTLQKLRLASGPAELSGQGELHLDAQQSYRFDGRLQHFDLAAFMPHSLRSDLNATLAASGALQPRLNGVLDLNIGDSRLAQHAVGGKAHLSYSDSRHGQGELRLRVGDNQLDLVGGYGSAADSLRLDIQAPALAQLGGGYAGALQLHASFAGDPAHPDATLLAEARQLTLPSGYQLDSLSANASLHGGALAVQAQAGALDDANRTLLQNASLDVQGSTAAHELRIQMQLPGTDTLQLRAQGGWPDAEHWQGTLTALDSTGRINTHLLQAAPLSMAPRHLSLHAAQFALAGGHLALDELDWTPQQWRSRGQFGDLGLRMGLAASPAAGKPEALPALRLGGAWEVQSGAQLSGTLDIHRESGDILLAGARSAPLGLDKLQFKAQGADGRISSELEVSGTRLGELHARLSMAQTQRDGHWQLAEQTPLSGQLHIAANDLSWIGAALEGELKTGGRLLLDADVAGTLHAPRLLGQVQGDALAFAWLDQGVRLEQGHLAARFDQQTLHIDELVFIAPHDAPPRDTLLTGVNIADSPGALHASGNIDLAGNDSDLEISAYQVPLTQRKDRWIVASGNGHARLKDDTLSLSGNIVTDAGLIRPQGNDRPHLSDDVVLVGRHVPKRQNTRIAVDASLDLGERFYLRASGLETRLAGKLNAQQTPGQALRVTGSISTRDARFEAYGQSLTVERGIVNFNGPIYDPGLNILALRKGLSVEAGVTVTGTALHPVVQLVSMPNVADTEKLSWIVLGRPPDASGTDLSLLLAAAEGVVGGAPGGVTGQLKQSMGIDQLTLRANTSTTGTTTQTTASNDPLSNQVAVVGKRLSARAYLSYEQGVTAAAGVSKLTYTLTPRVNVITQAGFENAIDVLYSFSFE